MLLKSLGGGVAKMNVDANQIQTNYNHILTNRNSLVNRCRRIDGGHMKIKAKARVGGYQGSRSILTASLQELCRDMTTSGCFDPVLTEDVTATGLAARDLFAGVESGAFDIAYMASGYLAARVPELGLLDLPFAVSDRAAAFKALDGNAGILISAAVERDASVKVLGFWDNGFRHISNNRHPVLRPADCQAMTIRTLDSPIYCASLSAMGFTPVVTDVRDFREAIASGRIDAQENPLTNMLNFGIEAYHRYLSLTGHVFGIALLLCHRAWFDGLSAKQKQMLMTAAGRVTAVQRQLAAAEDQKALDALQRAGITVVMPEDIDLDAFKSAVEPIWQDVRAGLPRELIHAYLG
jgi:TRAP-type transport system periplasmic protein